MKTFLILTCLCFAGCVVDLEEGEQRASEAHPLVEIAAMVATFPMIGDSPFQDLNAGEAPDSPWEHCLLFPPPFNEWCLDQPTPQRPPFEFPPPPWVTP